ncbi:hypothetical protein SAY86_002736 [Trapa natans]|uniref:Uncharacterized protein n=1 Tax=Trapa natans TaxID=22666 RepID=A0AAN7R1A1_TRANT|nr:hypothetical protein SAY86_002736 [Trapa natans]
MANLIKILFCSQPQSNESKLQEEDDCASVSSMYPLNFQYESRFILLLELHPAASVQSANPAKSSTSMAKAPRSIQRSEKQKELYSPKKPLQFGESYGDEDEISSVTSSYPLQAAVSLPLIMTVFHQVEIKSCCSSSLIMYSTAAQLPIPVE